MLLAESFTEHIIGLAIEVHRRTGPGSLEPFDEQCLRVALRPDAIPIASPIRSEIAPGRKLGRDAA